MLDPRLERNYECPICHRPVHRIDVNNNPIPDRETQRTEEDICQCGKGKAVRELRRQERMRREEAREQRLERREELLTRKDRNRVYWENVGPKEDMGGEK